MNWQKYGVIVVIILALIGVSNVSMLDVGLMRQGEICDRDTDELTTFNGTYFTGSGNCVNCHNTDPLNNALVDENGNDVSPVNDWMATMMANSAKDPFWRAKVSHETFIYPNLQDEIENTCTRCHAPMAHYENSMSGGDQFLMAHLDTSELGLDGVGCIACHGISATGLGETFVGEMIYDSTRKAFGPFANPWDGPMNAQTGFNPVLGDHIRQSELCASCHSLFTETIDMEGNPTGNTFFEQSTYHEWLNSTYAENQTECQTCHVPETDQGVIVSNQPNWLFPQTPFGKHHFVGGNAFMLKLMKDNISALDIAATPDQFDMVLGRTLNQLQQQTLDINLEKVNVVNDTLEIEVGLANNAGHKFPSGYPSRLSFVEFTVKDQNDSIIFQNGLLDEGYRIIDRDVPFEPHHNRITDESMVQIYEMVMVDVNDSVTTVLERAKDPIKDNRIPPIGFTTTHLSYDTAEIAGLALLDENFNFDNEEGSGKDLLRYAVALGGYEGDIHVEAKVYYQSLPPRWMDEMFAVDTEEILAFKSMYEEADHTPVLIASQTLQTDTEPVSVVEQAFEVNLYPNPVSSEVLFVNLEGHNARCRILNSGGQVVFDQIISNQAQLSFTYPQGVYFVVLETAKGRVVRKVLKL